MILFVALAATVAFQARDPQGATFHAGTRLVEVEVVVRNKNGPVTNLTKDDFTVLDQDKAQRIDVFHAGQSTTAAPSVPLLRGMVSNRGGGSEGTSAASAGYTAVLYDRFEHADR